MPPLPYHMSTALNLGPHAVNAVREVFAGENSYFTDR